MLPLGQDPAFASASPDEISEIDVTANAYDSQVAPVSWQASPLTTPLGFSFTDARYTHIAVRHIGFKFPFTSQFYPAYGSKAALSLLINLILAEGPGVLQPNGNFNWTYNLGIPIGLDASSFGGSDTSWLTLIVNPNAPGGPTVWTMYPSGPVSP